MFCDVADVALVVLRILLLVEGQDLLGDAAWASPLVLYSAAEELQALLLGEWQRGADALAQP